MELELQNMKTTELDRYTLNSPKNAFWEVVYDYNGNYSIFLTEDEKEGFLEAIKRHDYFEIRGMILSKRFLLIRYNVELKQKEEKMDNWKHDVNTTRGVINQMEEHFKKVAEERKKNETKN
jgi:hypothetical protein